jgi:hypothetical protein
LAGINLACICNQSKTCNESHCQNKNLFHILSP